MRDTLTVGLTAEAHHTVTADMATSHLPVAVLATPTMVALIEAVCMATAAPHLDAGETTVGTHICVSHDAGVSDGEGFTIRCRLASIVKRRLTFDVEVTSATARVSVGTHQRAVVRIS